MQGILSGYWPIRFTLSVGPLYHYLIAPIVAVAGLNYFGLKLASVIVSVGVLLATYGLSRNLIDDYFALLAVAVAGVSSWLLIFSRLGDVEILVPLLTTGALWLVVRVAKQSRRADVVACAVVSSLGLYTYPQAFVLPGVMFITLLCLRWAGHRVTWAELRSFVLVTIACAVPFAWIVYLDRITSPSGTSAARSSPRAAGSRRCSQIASTHCWRSTFAEIRFFAATRAGCRT